MHKAFGKDELAIILFTLVFSLVYRIFDDYHFEIISPRTGIFILMFSVAYLCFNRVIKLLIDLINNKFYDSFLTIRDITYQFTGSGRYEVYIGNYIDIGNQKHIKEIHSSFSIRKWKIGDRIKIKISTDDPEKIIISHSDFALAFIMSAMGMLFETILFLIYVNIQL